MFRTPNVYGMVTGFNVRVKDEREQDRNHLIEVTYELPLSYELADEILPAMARDLFMKGKDGNQPRPEIKKSVFDLSVGQQVMEVKTHPDLPAEARIEGVSLRKIAAVKAEAGTWLLQFTATWQLGHTSEAVLMIQRLKQGVYLSLTEQAPKLGLSGEDDIPAASPEANVAAGPGRRRGRPRKDADVAADGKSAAAGDESAAEPVAAAEPEPVH